MIITQVWFEDKDCNHFLIIQL